MKKLFILSMLVLPLAASAHADPFLVVPGRSLGQTHVGTRGTADMRRLPRPDGGDAAMGGRRWFAWKSKTSSDTLAVFGLDRGFNFPPHSGITVEDIRATSPCFHTSNGVSPGATLTQIKTRFPKGQLGPANDSTSWFYTVRQGIAFEFHPHPQASSRCLSVIVFSAGSSELGSVDLMTAQTVEDMLQDGAQ